MAHSIQLLSQVVQMAKLAYLRDAARNSHPYAPGSDHAHAFEAEWDRCAAADVLLRGIRAMPMRARPVGGVQP